MVPSSRGGLRSGESPRNQEEKKELKFKILPKIHDFSDAQGNVYRPGDTVELPEENYLGLNWLEPIEEKPTESDMEMSQEKASEPTPPEKPRQRRRKNDA
jgi:hypothetical protein